MFHEIPGFKFEAAIKKPRKINTTVKVICGDSVAVLKSLPDESIDSIVTSPPYDNLRTYGGHSWDFKGTAKEIGRVLKPGAVCCWVVGDAMIKGSESLTSFKQAIFFKEQVGLLIHDTMIYEKGNFSSPSSNRYHQTFEYIFILSKGNLACFNPIKDKVNIWAGTGTFGKNTIREVSGEMTLRKRNIITDYGMRGNVWRGKTRGQEEMCIASIHPAMMPKWLARDLILSWSNKGDTVLDFFAGSGTVGHEAKKLDRSVILSDINPEYIPLLLTV